MLSDNLGLFLTDLNGGGTITVISWFALLAGICGLARIMTDGLRNRPMLQATSDVVALAAAIDLPGQAAVKATALTYAAKQHGFRDQSRGSIA